MLNLLAMFITIAGAVNWFVIGVFQFDIIAGLFGSQSVFMSRFVYTLIGVAGFYIILLILFKKGTLELNPKKAKLAYYEKIRKKEEEELALSERLDEEMLKKESGNDAPKEDSKEDIKEESKEQTSEEQNEQSKERANEEDKN